VPQLRRGEQLPVFALSCDANIPMITRISRHLKIGKYPQIIFLGPEGQ